ncbi:MAG: RluA family pseudouridine synthase [Planctomycetota bacterium]|nr:RluA family pseudouridine synthase [Planctomycetota bacterium]
MGIFKKDRDLTQAPKEVELRVDASFFRMRAEELEMRLDAFLAAHLTWRSRASIQELIKDGYVLIDPSTLAEPRASGTAVVERKPSRKLRHGARVIVVIPEDLRAPMTLHTSSELVVSYEDPSVLVVDKPPNMAVHPSGRYLVDTLIQRVHARYGAGFELETAGAPRLCHRLDRETSGLVVIGRTPTGHADVQQQFERREVEKEYLTIVHGVPDRDSGVIDYPIGQARASHVGIKMAIAVDGQDCRTSWRVIERKRNVSLVACEPFTGRQHQIRVHMAAIGHPVVGDKLYGDDDSYFEKGLAGTLSAQDMRELGMDRHALHNHRIAFRSPETGEWIEVLSPLPSDMQAYFDQSS